jgi:hypothetical protein
LTFTLSTPRLVAKRIEYRGIEHQAIVDAGRSLVALKSTRR